MITCRAGHMIYNSGCKFCEAHFGKPQQEEE